MNPVSPPLARRRGFVPWKELSREQQAYICATVSLGFTTVETYHNVATSTVYWKVNAEVGVKYQEVKS